MTTVATATEPSNETLEAIERENLEPRLESPVECLICEELTDHPSHVCDCCNDGDIFEDAVWVDDVPVWPNAA